MTRYALIHWTGEDHLENEMKEERKKLFNCFLKVFKNLAEKQEKYENSTKDTISKIIPMAQNKSMRL